jgi:hypothetical protein
METQILSYGGGKQTVAMIVLIAKGLIPRPDRIVTADTSREVGSTWAYLTDHMQPFLAKLGMTVEVAPHSLATVDVYGHNGNLLLPVYTGTGKFSTYCSNEWKSRVIDRYLRAADITEGIRWIGFAFDERKRWDKPEDIGPWKRRFPLVELMVSSTDCPKIIESAGLPVPRKSRCWNCPHQTNEEWRELTPAEFENACRMDDEIRENDDRNGVYLHQSRIALREADLNAPDRKEPNRQCGLGLCMI